MKKFECNQYGRTIILNLTPGELVLETIKSELEVSNVKNAVLVSALGSLRKLNLHVIGATTPDPQDIHINIEAPVEIGVMQGLILDGAPHIHLVASTPNGNTYIGHLEPGCQVQYLMELCFLEIKDMDLVRCMDSHGIGYIEKKQ